MISSSEKLESLFKKFSEKEKDLALKSRFPYIFTKAFCFLKDGPNLYRQKDAFNFPDDSFSEHEIKLIEIGCNQLIKGFGFSRENPFKNIGINGIHKLFKLFHFDFKSQQAFKTVNDNFIDKMTFKHIVNHDEVIYYNYVD